jgi:hypothetical protein
MEKEILRPGNIGVTEENRRKSRIKGKRSTRKGSRQAKGVRGFSKLLSLGVTGYAC